MTETIDLQQEALYNARLRVKSRWYGYNEVVFNMLSPKKVLKYLPKEAYGPEEVYIGLSEEKEYDVKRRPIKAANQEKTPSPAQKPEAGDKPEEAKAAEGTAPQAQEKPDKQEEKTPAQTDETPTAPEDETTDPAPSDKPEEQEEQKEELLKPSENEGETAPSEEKTPPEETDPAS